MPWIKAMTSVDVTLVDTMSRMSTSRRSFRSRPNGSSRRTPRAIAGASFSMKKRMQSMIDALKMKPSTCA